MNKKAYGILSLVFFLFIFSMRVISNSFASMINPKPKVEVEVESLEDVRFRTFKKAIEDSTYFKDSQIVLDASKIKVTINGKYNVYIKNGLYSMRIDDPEDETYYCQIVDSVEQSFGEKPGSSMSTCMETLKGSIEIGGISAEIFDSYKILSVKSNEKALLYDVLKSHVNGELISVDEINYNIKFDDYLLTSLKPKYDDTKDIFNICGHIYNKDKVGDEFIFSLYDEKKEMIDQVNYAYNNDTKKFLSFCVEKEIDTDIVRYYSIEKAGE